MRIESFEQLNVWKEAHGLVLEVYRLTNQLPDAERCGLVSQMRRAAVSVPANIAEGFERKGGGDKSRFYNIAQASLEELRYYFILCRDLGYLPNLENVQDAIDHTGRMLTRLIRAVDHR